MKTTHAGPNFIGLGCQKAGTRWLFDQLASHPQFHMPPLKELHYFDHAFEWEPLRRLHRQAATSDSPNSLSIKNPYRPPDDNDLKFLNASRKMSGQTIDLTAYAALFDFFPGLCGDITPSYCTLSPSEAQQIAAALKTTRFILIIREPVQRAWSQFCMFKEKGRLPSIDYDDSTAILEWLTTPEINKLSFASKCWQTWSDVLKSDQLLTLDFEHIRTEPARTRAAVIEFIGANASFKSSVAPGFNKKSGAPKARMAPEVFKALSQFFEDEQQACREILGKQPLRLF